MESSTKNQDAYAVLESACNDTRRVMRQEGLTSRLGPRLFIKDTPPRILVISEYPKRNNHTDIENGKAVLDLQRKLKRVHELLTEKGLTKYQCPRDPSLNYTEEARVYVLSHAK